MEYLELLNLAKSISLKAYAPYSGIHVGAVILTKNNTIFKGVNIENSSYGLTVCAERTAIGNAITEGEKEFKAIAVYSRQIQPIYPCGACRQVLCEFNSEMDIVLFDPLTELKVIKLNILFPNQFGLS